MGELTSPFPVFAEDPEPAPRIVPCVRCSKSMRLDGRVPRWVNIYCEDCYPAYLAEKEEQKRQQAKFLVGGGEKSFEDHVGVPTNLRAAAIATWDADATPIPGAVSRWLASPDRNLILQGPTGSGKTHLAVACLRAVWDRGERSIWMCEAPNLNAQLLEEIRSGQSALTDRLAQRRYVLFDDIGRGRESGFSRDAFSSIVHHRHAESRISIVTTNRPLRELYFEDPPTWSRLLENAERVPSRDTDPPFCTRDWRLRGGQ